MARRKSSKKQKVQEVQEFEKPQLQVEQQPQIQESQPQAQEPIPQVVSEDYIRPSLKQEELLLLRALEAETKAMSLEARIIAIEKAALLRKIDPENKIEQMNQGIDARKEIARKKKLLYVAAISKIEKRLGISMSEYSFDDETGTLTKMQ